MPVAVNDCKLSSLESNFNFSCQNSEQYNHQIDGDVGFTKHKAFRLN